MKPLRKWTWHTLIDSLLFMRLSHAKPLCRKSREETFAEHFTMFVSVRACMRACSCACACVQARVWLRILHRATVVAHSYILASRKCQRQGDAPLKSAQTSAYAIRLIGSAMELMHGVRVCGGVMKLSCVCVGFQSKLEIPQMSCLQHLQTSSFIRMNGFKPATSPVLTWMV